MGLGAPRDTTTARGGNAEPQEGRKEDDDGALPEVCWTSRHRSHFVRCWRACCATVEERSWKRERERERPGHKSDRPMSARRGQVDSCPDCEGCLRGWGVQTALPKKAIFPAGVEDHGDRDRVTDFYDSPYDSPTPSHRRHKMPARPTPNPHCDCQVGPASRLTWVSTWVAVIDSTLWWPWRGGNDRK